jgi:hypothetical protein
MANFKIPDLCGASTQLNLASSKIEDLESQITLQINAEASAAKAAIESKLTDVKLGLDGLVPDLPELPNLNLQADIFSLLSIDNSTVSGAVAYATKLNDLKIKFGDKLKEKGLVLENLISDLVEDGTENLCSIVPNLEIPAAGGNVIEKSQGVKTATENAIEETLAQIKGNVSLSEDYVSSS